ncbi:DNA polymerase-3 subunit gamma/tau [Micromonospora pallida]|uniref:DNA polymerase III subunit gamma/tau n=1 Tax=Micromonospora pallida TaxID=145854 RepID=A0A1C6TDJ1_9ACTN|nr:DNA polymerase III subunit gamma and tau [Micromonospora pallida]SCL39769.1 DNA polymerase-3 subunit gamma/tau [Micromonospora pallida]
MALALYRKYRPRTFAEVIGQEHVTEPLSQALRSGRLNHAYLFSGPRGCGKTSSARILARSLNCEQGPTPEPCGQCGSCRSLSSDGAGSIDVIEIDAASHGGVDDARELREKAFFAPANSRFKIYVIDEAHMVSSAGFNALLKLVEEPPEYVKFIFATTEPEKVLGTIKSRTHHYPFRLIPPKVLRPYLEQLCEAEGVTVDPAVFPLVVRAGGGSARDSLSVLDQLIAGAGPEGVSYARAAALLGVTDSALIDEMCDALAAGDGAAAYATVDRVAEAGHDPRRFASDLLERLRDLIVLQQVPDAADKGLIDGPTDQVERMTAQAQRLGQATLSRCADIVHNGLVEMRGTTGPRLLLELICARMLLPGADDSTGGLLQRLERMERRLTLGVPVADVTPAPGPAQPEPVPARTEPTPTHTEAPAAVVPSASEPAAPRRVAPPEAVLPDPVTPEPPRPDAPASGTLDVHAVRNAWRDRILPLIKQRNKRAGAMIQEASVGELEGDTLVLSFKHSFHAQSSAGHADLIGQAVQEVLGGRWQIRCEVAGERGGSRASAGPSRPAATPPPPAASPPPARPAPTPPAAPQRSNPAGAASPASAARPSGDSGGPAAEEDWPEPARPGGAAAAATAATASGADDWPEPARPGGADGWPEPARPGGAAVPAGRAEPTPSGGAVPPSPRAADTTAPARPAAPASPPAPAGGAPVSSGRAAARAAAARGAGRTAEPARGARTDAARKTADSEFAGEPPYDPDYDGPVRGGGRVNAAPPPTTPSYEGFDPGDEPLDDVIDERVARQSSEEQAVQLLREVFGAEKIAEVEAR